MLLPSASWQVTQVSSPTKLLAWAGSVAGEGAVAWVAVAAAALRAVSGPTGGGAAVLPLAAITATAVDQTSASAVTSVRAGKPSLRGFMRVEPLSKCRRESGGMTGSHRRGCNSD